MIDIVIVTIHVQYLRLNSFKCPVYGLMFINFSYVNLIEFSKRNLITMNMNQVQISIVINNCISLFTARSHLAYLQGWQGDGDGPTESLLPMSVEGVPAGAQRVSSLRRLEFAEQPHQEYVLSGASVCPLHVLSRVAQ